MAKELDVLSQIFNEGAVDKDYKEKPHANIPTQFTTFNAHILGIGGLPRGRIIELAAEENVGKSSFALNLAGSLQKQGLKVAIIAAEPIDYQWAETCGCDMRDKEHGCENPIYIADKTKGVSNSHDFAAKMKTILALDIFDLIVVDSIGRINPPEMIEEEGGMSMYDKAQNATFWGIFLRQLEGGFIGKLNEKNIKNKTPIMEWKKGKPEANDDIHKIEQKKACVVLINHLKDGVGMFASKYTSGGKNKDFTFSHRIWMMTAKTYLDAKKNVVKKDIKFLLKKGKLGAPSGRNMIMEFRPATGKFSELGDTKGFEEVPEEDE